MGCLHRIVEQTHIYAGLIAAPLLLLIGLVSLALSVTGPVFWFRRIRRETPHAPRVHR